MHDESKYFFSGFFLLGEEMEGCSGRIHVQDRPFLLILGPYAKFRAICPSIWFSSIDLY